MSEADDLNAASLAGASFPLVRQPAAAQVAPSGLADRIRIALAAAAPHAPASVWLSPLLRAVAAADALTNRQLAAFVGAWVPEVGEDYSELSECTNWRPETMVRIFPSRIHSLAQAQELHAKGPDAMADVAYAFKLGNRGPETHDGSRFKGAGCAQITGRDEYTEFAKWCGKSVEDAGAWARTPEGAAMAGAFYWTTRRLNRLADAWNLHAIRLAVNGQACLGEEIEVAASERALAALGG